MSKFKVIYTMTGEVEIEASSFDEAVQNFNDRCGVTEDTIYENLDNNPVVDYIEKL